MALWSHYVAKKAILGTNKNINKSKTIEFNVRSLLHVCINML